MKKVEYKKLIESAYKRTYNGLAWMESFALCVSKMTKGYFYFNKIGLIIIVFYGYGIRIKSIETATDPEINCYYGYPKNFKIRGKLIRFIKGRKIRIRIRIHGKFFMYIKNKFRSFFRYNKIPKRPF